MKIGGKEFEQRITYLDCILWISKDGFERKITPRLIVIK